MGQRLGEVRNNFKDVSFIESPATFFDVLYKLIDRFKV